MAETIETITEESKETTFLSKVGYFVLDVLKNFTMQMGMSLLLRSLAPTIIYGATFLVKFYEFIFFDSKFYDYIPTIFCGDKTFDSIVNIPFNLYNYGTSYYTTPIINGYHHSVDFCVDSYNAVVDFFSSSDEQLNTEM
jgi:hypothetical protein